MARKARSTCKTRPPIPLEAIEAIGSRIGRSLKGWDECPPLFVSPPPERVEGVYFDVDAVVRVVQALRCLRHTKGKWAGVPFDPEPWQVVWVIAPVWGWRKPDGKRAIQTVWWELPRKNGKSTCASGLALVLLAADGEQGAEVYAAAASRDQARIVFDESKKMAMASPALSGKVKPYKSSIYVPKTGSAFKVLSKVAEVAHGLNVSGAIVDEVHVHKSRALIDALETGTGAREQPLIVFITTADEGESTTIYAEKHEYAEKCAAGVIDDPTFWGVIWAATEKDDPYSEVTWRKANPGYGVTVRPDWIRKEAAKAKETPTYYTSFCRLILNRRIRMVARWLPEGAWDASAGLLREDELPGRECYGGLDLASTTDLAAFCLLFPFEDHVRALWRIWVPEATVIERTRSANVPYETWVRQGWITATEGNVIDYDRIRADIQGLADRYGIKEVGYDPWNATQIVTQLQGDGLTMVPVRQGYATLSAPTKEMQKRVLEKRFVHGGNPVVRWCAHNMVLSSDPAGNVKPAKDKSTEKIDPLAAAVNAMDRLIRHEDSGESVYEERGILAL
jgi:phage terminase large subunit-like protein